MNKVSHESSPLVSGKESIPRIALIGAGGYGATHLGALERLMKGERARLQAVAEPRMDAELQSRLDGLGVTAYSQMSDLLEKEPLDLLAISTPITFHYAMTQEALKKGLYIFLEKPPVPLIHQLEGLIQCDVEKKVLVGFHYVNQLIGRQLKRWMVQGDLGKIKSIRAIFASPRGSIYYQRARWAGKMVLNGEPVFDGPMTNAMSHILNLILFLGGKSEEEFGVPQEVEGEFYRARAIDSYDTACMRGVFPSGTTFGFACSHAVENGSAWKFEITGSKGKAWVEEGKVLNDQNLSFSFQESDFEDPVMTHYQNLFDYRSGKIKKCFIGLEETRGYVLATNAALVSSQGIHTIPEDQTRTYTNHLGDGIDVPAIPSLLDRFLQSEALFSEQGVSWSKKPSRVFTADLKSQEIQKWF